MLSLGQYLGLYLTLIWEFLFCAVGVYVTVPEGAIQKGCKEEMFLAVLREDNDRLKLAGTIMLHLVAS